jgi:hypothetical protein
MKTVDLDPLAFLRAGGVLSLAEWIQLDPGEKAAFATAGRLVAGEQAERVAEEIIGALAALGEQEQLNGMVDRAFGEGGG